MAATFKVGNRVREAASPHRRGTVRVVLHTGTNARILVGLDGFTQVWYYPAQLVKI